MESYGKARLSPGQTLFLTLARSRSQAPTNRRSLPWMHRFLKCTKHPNRGSFHDFIDFLKCLKHPSRGSLPRVHRACLPACFWSQVAKDRSGRQKFQKLQKKSNQSRTRNLKPRLWAPEPEFYLRRTHKKTPRLWKAKRPILNGGIHCMAFIYF